MGKSYHEDYIKALNGDWDVKLTPGKLFLMNGLEILKGKNY